MKPDDCYNIPNPLFDLLVYLNENDADRLEKDDELQMLIKNCRTNFYKLSEAVNQIADIQKEPELLQRLPILKMQSVEYCFIKISTTWDIAYEIMQKLLKPEKGKLGKFDALEKSFEAYAAHLPSLKLDWYREVNKIRNRVVHGGINVIVFHEDNQISFQAYNNDVEEKVRLSAFFCVEGRPLIYAERYFSFYTALLYYYLVDIFRYVHICLANGSNPVNTPKEDTFGDPYTSFKCWPVNGLERLNSICDAMRNNRKDERLPFENIQGEPFYD